VVACEQGKKQKKKTKQTLSNLIIWPTTTGFMPYSSGRF